MDEHRIVGDDELKRIVCTNADYSGWLQDHVIDLDKLPEVEEEAENSGNLISLKIAAGITKEDETLLLHEMIWHGKEAISSMGNDIPLAILSKNAQHLCNYFRQNFAQVTNPPIDAIREKMYMSLHSYLGVKGNPIKGNLGIGNVIDLASPALSWQQFLRLKSMGNYGPKIISIFANFDPHPSSLEPAIQQCCKEAEQAVNNGASCIVLDNSNITFSKASIPMLLVSGAVHHHLISKGLRQKCSIICCAIDVLEAHHFACLLGFGADAIFAKLTNDLLHNLPNVIFEEAEKNYLKAVNDGLLKIMSKLGISTLLSYKGAQTFEALGLHMEVIDLCFPGTISRIGGMKIEDLAKEQLHKHYLAFNWSENVLPDVGKFQWRQNGEYHLFNPTTIHLLQHATKSVDYPLFKKYSEAMNKQEKNKGTLRSLFELKSGDAIPLEEVEDISSIMKRFATGAMSFGSISAEAHATLAKAMNYIGGKSNCGEGGEDSNRYLPREDGYSTNSAIKQVASGRFGVTINYLANAKEIQIKMAQGAKPGEGGQLPGHKVNENIARIRHSTAGVGLISPPPHHDIYSIEDLAQLIFDLKNANADARISVKLVSKAGVGIIAAGVAKGHADHILISGHDGGTGASPLSSIMYAGLPWELGLAETHQTLMRNGLRDRVTLQTDGQIRTGKDLAIATLLGAEEWGIATAALVVSGCILMRKCHLNTCPVGIATQDEKLRDKYHGKVEDLVTYFTFLAMEMREIMASLGFRTVNEMVGRTDFIATHHHDLHWKYKNLDLSPMLWKAVSKYPILPFKNVDQKHGIDDVLDRKLIKYSELAIQDHIQINSIFEVSSVNRAVGTMLSGLIAKKYGDEGLKDESIRFGFKGSAGQSFGAFGIKGLEFTLEGEANDFFGKGLSGATLIVVPSGHAKFVSSDNVIIGNVALFGATSGNVFIRGRAGERFAVRNSGANAVVEGVGDNACEYMTGGTVVILQAPGKNFASGMSGGIAFVYDPQSQLPSRFDDGNVIVSPVEDEDYILIQQMIRAHFLHTASPFALELLSHWQDKKLGFRKIIALEYKKILDTTTKQVGAQKMETKYQTVYK